MGEKVERISGSFFRGFSVGGSNILPLLTRRIDSLNTPAFLAAASSTYTAAQIGRGIIIRDMPFASTDTLPTGPLLIAGVANVYTLAEIGDSIQFQVRNASAHTLTLAPGSRIELQGDFVIPAGGTRVLTATRTTNINVTVIAVDPLATPGQTPVQASTISTVGVATYTGAQYLGGYIARDPNGANRTDVTPTATSINSARPSLIVGSFFDTTIKNTADAAESVSLSGGIGVTVIGTITISQNETGVVRTIKTGATTYDVVQIG